MKVRKNATLVCFCMILTLFFSALPQLHAEVVNAIDGKGTLSLDDGSKVRLAGVVLDEAGLRLLSVLLAGKEVQIKDEKSAAAGEREGYVYVKTEEIPMPFSSDKTSENTIMVNELLITLGAARVDESADFRYYEKFLALQDKARIRAEGIWSYQ